jgi:hypothetical protein
MRKKVPTEAQRVSAAAQLELLRHPGVDDAQLKPGSVAFSHSIIVIIPFAISRVRGT